MAAAITGEFNQPSRMLEYTFGNSPRGRATLDEERQEVFAAVQQALRTGQPDNRERAAACTCLLRHLVSTAHPW